MTLTPVQRQIAAATERYLVLVAGRRFGKTVLAVRWLCDRVLAAPDSLGYYVAPYRVMAKAIAWEMLLRVSRPFRTAKNDSELTVTLINGARVALKGADDPETLEGVGLVAVVLDEFARMKLDAWQKSIRPALSDKGGRALFCGKPRGHNHLKDFYERGQDGPTKRPGWRSWLFRTIDGGHVPAADVAEARASLPAKVYRQEYEATFESLAGRVYDGFDRRAHVLPHAEIERRFKLNGRWNFRRIGLGIDWGYVDPGVALVAGVTAAGQLVVVAEAYASGRLVDDAGWLATFRALRDECRPDVAVADPSEPGFIAATRRALDANPVVQNAQNDWREGHRRLSVALLPRPGSDPHAVDPPRGLVVSDRCVNLIREFEVHVFAEAKGQPTEAPEVGNDHCLDALRYLGMALLPASR